MYGSIHRRIMLLVLALVTSAATAASPVLARCGVERWDVKTGTDPDAAKVDLSAATPTTIATLVGLPRPAPYPPVDRAATVETTLWVIDATLTEFKFENSSTTGDSDYHLVLVDGEGNTMVGEIPSPDCVGAGSPFAAGIAQARAQFDARFTAEGQFQTANVPVRVTGVGMFDFAHGQTGAAPNVIELHPIVNIVFNPGSPDSTPTPTVAEPNVEPTLTPTVPPDATVTVTPGGDSDTVVFFNRHGHAYHRADCRYTGPSSTQTTVEEAKQRGLSPCGVCKPPQ